MPRRFLIVHGIDNHRETDHWERLLADSLRDRGEQVLYPQLPRPDAPLYEEWEEVLHAELEMLGDGERVVVCHSLGCSLWLRAVPRPPVDRVLLVAPPGRATIVRLAPSFAERRPDAGGITAAARATTFVTSDADPYDEAGDTAAFARAAGARHEVIAGGGHLSVDDGYGSWPAAEAWCLDPGSERF